MDVASFGVKSTFDLDSIWAPTEQCESEAESRSRTETGVEAARNDNVTENNTSSYISK